MQTRGRGARNFLSKCFSGVWYTAVGGSPRPRTAVAAWTSTLSSPACPHPSGGMFWLSLKRLVGLRRDPIRPDILVDPMFKGPG